MTIINSKSTSRRKALVLCTSDIRSDPRPYRMVQWLQSNFNVTACAKGEGIHGVEFISIGDSGSNGLDRAINLFYLALRRFDKVIWKNARPSVVRQLKANEFKLVVSHNLHLLPFAEEVRRSSSNNCKILFDAREYYPRHFENRLFWRMLRQPLNKYLCDRYLPLPDQIITVSEGLAHQYECEYGVNAVVVPSFPEREDLIPSSVSSDKIRLLHHGNASKSRGLEIMIEMMENLDPRFTLDMMLIPRDERYYRYLTKLAAVKPNVQIIPPVPMKEICTVVNEYDIGIFLCRPATVNLKYVLPNKLFEFIQGRVAVAIGPSVEMAKYVRKYSCGVISKDFEPTSLADELSKLTVEDIVRLKQNSHAAAAELNANAARQLTYKVLEKMGVHCDRRCDR